MHRPAVRVSDCRVLSLSLSFSPAPISPLPSLCLCLRTTTEQWWWWFVLLFERGGGCLARGTESPTAVGSFMWSPDS
ncbi:hypothetical protein Hanom_Chr00s000002g01601141 [Helianthus anomalus]